MNTNSTERGIRDSHHFVRYCKPSQVEDGKVLVAAFHLRRKRGEDDLSVDWYEFFKERRYGNIVKSLTLRGFTPRKSGVLARINIGEAKRRIYNRYRKVIRLDNDHGSHCRLSGLGDDDQGIAPSFVSLIKEAVPLKSVA